MSVNLSVPYFSQLDNLNAPYGTCNLTSTAMVLSFLGAERRESGQFEDELFDRCQQMGLDRHDPNALALLIREYGCSDTFRPNARWEDARAWLSQGNPLIVHGYFTRSGHIIVIRGWDESGFIVNDPYGELMYDHSNPDSRYYDTSRSGEGLHYSNKLMEDLAGRDGDLWLHFCSR